MIKTSTSQSGTVHGMPRHRPESEAQEMLDGSDAQEGRKAATQRDVADPERFMAAGIACSLST
ncbi:MAG TPA: hypothetical protein VGT40_16005 [Methylomirabilota bacterium]|nr:hypothetical protein [Methylomirabilota bacterium]